MAVYTLPDAEMNYLADQQAARHSYFSIHTGDPAKTGANEATGGSYARVASNFAAAGAVGPLGSTLQPATVGVAWGSMTPTVAAGTYKHTGGWSAATAGTFRGGGQLSASIVMASGGATPAISVKVGPGVS
jgi:hypothetical protein